MLRPYLERSVENSNDRREGLALLDGYPILERCSGDTGNSGMRIYRNYGAVDNPLIESHGMLRASNVDKNSTAHESGEGDGYYLYFRVTFRYRLCAKRFAGSNSCNFYFPQES